MIYIENISANVRDAFSKKVKSIAYDLGIKADWLMTVMYAESRLKHTAVNAASGATGLIQFLPSTAARLGTSTSALKNMGAVEQLDYVKKYFLPYKSKLSNVYETYLAVFYPVALGKNNSYVLFSKGSIAYSQNATLDVDKDGKVTKSDVKAWFGKYVKTAAVQFNTSMLAAGFLIFTAFVLDKK